MYDLDALVDQVSRKLSSAEVRELAHCFSYPKPDPLEEIGSAYRLAGYLTLAQVSQLVTWKTSSRQTKQFLQGNDDALVRRVTELAAQTASGRQESPEQAASILAMLKAIHIATASTILTAWNPHDFGILDRRSWSALRDLTGCSTFDRGKRTLFRPDEFRLYTLLLRRWRDRVGVSPRTIDKALWQYDKESDKRA